MKSLEVDVAIVGAGTAGLTARKAALKHGARRVVMIEGGVYGTTCARVGCMPSKLLIAAAEAAHGIREAPVFGVRSEGGPIIDGTAVMTRVQRLRDRFAGGVVDAITQIPAEQKLRGWARFSGPNTLVVDDHTRVEARSIVLAAGSSPWTPPVFADLGDRVMTSDEVFEQPTLPKSVAVIGTGVIALELGQALHRLGVRTALFNPRSSVGPLRDPVMQTCVRTVLGQELDLRLESEMTSATRTADGVLLKWRHPNGPEREETFERVLSAAGRRANLERLALSEAGIELDTAGVPVFNRRTMQCGDSSVFIAGDVNGDRSLLHEAADEGRYAGTNAALFPDIRAHTRRTRMGIVFTDPQMAAVGEPGDHPDLTRGEIDYSDQGRALVMNQNRGLVRIWAKTECGHLTGAEMFGPGVEHMAHLLAWAIQQDMTVEQALTMPVYHPVVEEGLRTALRELAADLRLHGRPQPLDCGPGD